MAKMGRLHGGLPDDLLNFQYDAVACAVAHCWPGAAVEEARMQVVHDGELLHFHPAPTGQPMRILTDLDTESFRQYWLDAVEAAQSPT
jgi:hypothetical protein